MPAFVLVVEPRVVERRAGVRKKCGRSAEEVRKKCGRSAEEVRKKCGRRMLDRWPVIAVEQLLAEPRAGLDHM